jgi:hypothetical protein
MPRIYGFGTLKSDGSTTTESNGIMSVKDDGVTLAKQAHGTAGGIVYYGAGGAPTELAKDAGKYLKSGAAGVSWDTPAGGATPGWEFVDSISVSGAAVSSISFTGLDLDADRTYMLVCNVKNVDANQKGLRLEYNTDTTTTNYYRQIMQAVAANVTGGRVNDAEIGTLGASDCYFANIVIAKKASYYPRAFNFNARAATSSVEIDNIAHSWTSTNNVTSIQIVTHDGSSNIDVGSIFILMVAVV